MKRIHGKLEILCRNFRSYLHYGDWKLVVKKGARQLYKMAEDPEEKSDLAATHPEKLGELAKLLARQQVQDDDALPDRARD